MKRKQQLLEMLLTRYEFKYKCNIMLKKYQNRQNTKILFINKIKFHDQTLDFLKFNNNLIQ
ncbi:unnamed protein product [Paramecium sonneborni]|uniref:Uncharacterized protein n=1 Tax=Paramecium sonneborni TaxID=65129 RepID=A0A8S1MG80_9CILI|nr:unnamed protein product [Paramecium sonneborni]